MPSNDGWTMTLSQALGGSTMHIYHDEDADLAKLEGRRIAAIGYGNQGRAQALNLRDSGLDVIVGNRDDDYARRAREDGFPLYPIFQAAALADLIMLLIPDEAAPAVYEADILPHLDRGDASRNGPGPVLVFASGYNIAFGFISPPAGADVILVAPRMIGAGVRDLYVAGRGFPSFIGVAQDHSGQAREIALALTKGIGSTRMGAVEVTFQQEAELDLFTEQCFGPAFGHVLTTAVDLLLEEGHPPEAVLLELYMSGEFAYTLGKIAELGMVEQASLHSPTSQYGSMSRGMRFILPQLRTRMQQGLEEIRSGQFAQEWTAEQAAGQPALAALREAARSLPLHKLEQELLRGLRGSGGPVLVASQRVTSGTVRTTEETLSRTGRPEPRAEELEAVDLIALIQDGLQRFVGRFRRARPAAEEDESLTAGPVGLARLEQVLDRFLALAANDPALQAYSQGRAVTMHYVLRDAGSREPSGAGLEFTIRFADGQVVTGWGPPEKPAEVRLETKAEVLDGMFTGRIHAMRALMTGKLSFSGEAALAIGIQQIQEDLKRLYSQARGELTQSADHTRTV
jgi:ketol-acid reductoisomerase